jgi:hypothetical protein
MTSRFRGWDAEGKRPSFSFGNEHVMSDDLSEVSQEQRHTWAVVL